MSPATTSSHALRRLSLAVAACALVAALYALTVGSEAGSAQSPSTTFDQPVPAKERAGAGDKQGNGGKTGGGGKVGGGKTGGKDGGKGGKGGKDGGKEKPVRQPNIVMIMTDDQSKSTIHPESMPNLFNRMIPRGTTYSDYVVTTPLCCPSRSTVLTGEYGHNNGVLRNFYPDLKQKRNVLPAWLKYAGYNTAHVGKFLNSYEQGELGPSAVAPGWDLWFTELEKRRYYNWKASKNGRIRHYGTRNKDQATTVTSKFATRWTKRLVRKEAPFYMQFDTYAPHTSTGRDSRCAAAPVPEAQDEGRFDNYPPPKPPNYNEADVSDKPESIRTRDPLTADDDAAIARRYRCTLESVYGVDREIGRLLDVIKHRHELNNTVFIFSSDNGFFYGEHRIAKGKPSPYEENITMPLTIVVPKRYRNGTRILPTSDAPTANIDLAPTILDLASAEPCRTKRICRTMDGRSLLPIMDGTGGFPNPRGVGLELYGCDYRGARFAHQVYFENSREDQYGCTRTSSEFYDLASDPFQLDNLFGAPSGSATADAIERLRQMTQTLGDCAGIEGRDPAPASGHYCQ